MDKGLSDEDINKVANIIDLTDVIEKLPKGLNSYLGKIKSDGLDVSFLEDNGSE